MTRFILDRRPDVVHVNSCLAMPLMRALERVRDAIPLILTVHEYTHVCGNGLLYYRHGPCARKTLARCIECPLTGSDPGDWKKPWLILARMRRNMLRHASDRAFAKVNTTVFVSKLQEAHTLRMTSTAFSHQVIYNPYEQGAPPERTAQKRAGFITGGRLTYYKGVHHAIAAANRLKAPLTVIGQGAWESRLKRMAGPTVRFTGMLSPDRLRQELAAHRALLVPSLWPEPYPYLILDAFAAGTPVIAGSALAGTEIVTHGENGLIYDARDPDALAECMARMDDSFVPAPESMQAVLDRSRPDSAVASYTDLYSRLLG
jgi:glycosyltransferase involved in cell wall biosynthesis